MAHPTSPASLTADTRRQGIDRSDFRADIEGMRAIAVVAVMAWHAGLPWVSGGFTGVDIFFVISGYLMASVLLRDMAQHGRIRIGRFYMRRIRRLLPAAATALAGTALLTFLTVPALRWRDIAGDITAAALYFVNWRFASDAVDYLAQGEASSPVQHFWSLSVEEQFYLVLPVMFAVICLVIAGERWRRRALWLAITAVVVVSFAWSVYYTATDPGRAYFVTTTRMWQLAIGGLIALAAPFFKRMLPAAAAFLSWAGLTAVLAAIVLIDASDSFPGVVAALPTLGAAAMLAGGESHPAHGPVVVLRPNLIQRVGALSYSLYLWHWPVLVAAAAWFGNEDGDLRLRVSLVALVLCVVPAWLSFHFIEERLRRRPVRYREVPAATALLIACTCVSLAAAVGLAVSAHAENSVAETTYDEGFAELSDAVEQVGDALDEVGDVGDADAGAAGVAGAAGATAGAETSEADAATTSTADASPSGADPAGNGTSSAPADPAATSAAVPADTSGPLGALVLGMDPEGNPAGAVINDVPEIVPDPLLARDDLAVIYSEGCQRYVATPKVCQFGDANSDYRVALVGDSHAAHWFPAIHQVAEDRGWDLESITRPACPVNPVSVKASSADEAASCRSWSDATMHILLDDPPDLVIMSTQARYQAVDSSGKVESFKKSAATLEAGYQTLLEQLVAAGSDVVVIRDVPRPDFDMVDCVARHRQELGECDFDRAKSLADDPLQQAQIAADLPGTAAVDMTAAVCPLKTCAPVIGNVLIYRDGHHITQTYALSMTPLLSAAFDDVPFVPAGG